MTDNRTRRARAGRQAGRGPRRTRGRQQQPTDLLGTAFGVACGLALAVLFFYALLFGGAR